jgi:hypothetical protein
MRFPTLMAECDPPADVANLTADLMRRKAVSRELGAEPLPAPIAAFIDQEFETARPAFEGRQAVVSDEARNEADRFYREMTSRAFAQAPAPI